MENHGQNLHGTRSVRVVLSHCDREGDDMVVGNETNNEVLNALVARGIDLGVDVLGDEGFRILSHEVDGNRVLIAPRAPNERELRERAARARISVEEMRGMVGRMVPRVKPSETSFERFLNDVKHRLESRLPE